MVASTRKKETRGRKPATETIRIMSCGPGLRKVRFTLSEDVVEKLCEYAGDPLNKYNKHFLRLQFIRWPEIAPHVAMLQIAERTFEPTAPKLTQAKDGHRFRTELPARELGLVDGVAAQKLTMYYDDKRKGVLVAFDEADLIPASPPKNGSRKEPA